nr:uncharacterized protein LOC111415659 [Onthophagus taurus]
MESFTKEDQEIAQKLMDFYTDLVENHVDFLSYSLSDRVILDWFGKTIKGERNIALHLKDNTKFVHLLENLQPVFKIGHRDTHIVDVSKKQKSLTLNDSSSLVNSDEKTPPKTDAGSSHIFEQGQGDGLHNCELPVSPIKKFKKSNSVEEVVKIEDEDDMINCEECAPIRFVQADGFIEFRKKSAKKLQRETKWKRPCKLEIAYSVVGDKDFTIHLIIYSNEMKCKRNLLKDFESIEDE